MRIIVKPEHIEGAKRCDDQNCPLARAANEVVGNDEWVSVSETHLIVYGAGHPGWGTAYKLNGYAQDAVEQYDQGSEFPEGEYEAFPDTGPDEEEYHD